jgi:predicted dehydrogenase
MAAGSRVRVGFLGCGLIAGFHARGLRAVDGAEIVAAHDIDGARAARFAREWAGTAAAAAGSAEEVIAASDAVYVCTWTSTHQALVEAVVAAGKPVFCEKPLATDLAGAEAMTAAVARSGVVNQVGLVLRASPSFRWLRHLVNQPEAGPLMNIVFRDDQYLPTQGMYQSTWRADRTLAGAGTLLEHSIHDLDLLRWLMGPIRSVSANLGYVHGLDGIDDQASVLLVAASGAQAALISVWHDVLSRASQRRVEAFCQAGVFTLTHDWRGPVSGELASGPIETLEGQRLTEAAAGADGLAGSPDAAFIDAVRTSKQAHPGFEVALEAHRLADAAYRSAAAGGSPISVGA